MSFIFCHGIFDENHHILSSGISLKIQSDKAKKYEKWFSRFEENALVNLKVDSMPYTHPEDAITVLRFVRRVGLVISFISISAILIDFMYGRELYIWAVNYAGDFIRIIPKSIE